MSLARFLAANLFVASLTIAVEARPFDELRDKLWAAVRNGDADAIAATLDQGCDVNAQNEIGISALWIAAGKDKPEIVELLIARGADVNVRDLIWYQTPLVIAAREGSDDSFTHLLAANAEAVDEAASMTAMMGKVHRLRQVLETNRVSPETLDAILFGLPESKAEIREMLVQAGAKPLPPAEASDRERWNAYVGKYENDNAGSLELAVGEVGLMIKSAQGGGTVFREIGPDRFAVVGNPNTGLSFERSGDQVTRAILRRFTAEAYYYPAKPIATPVSDPASESTAGNALTPVNWPQFRGPDASGVADGQNLPLTWDVQTGENVKWKTPIPGLGHSCPIVWEDRVFLTTAVSGDPDPKIRTGNYGDVESVDDTTVHTWHVLCLDRKTGEILWNRKVREGVPKIKRHLKGSQANCTPVTDGRHVVACFGPEGLYCFDFAGNQLWSRDLSTIDSSFAMDQEYEWGFGSSPIIHDGLVIAQFDLSKDSFIAAYSLEDGSKVWDTPRDEIPSWSSPAAWRNSQRSEIVTNAAQYARSYDPATGQELWRLAKKSEVTIPAPVPNGDVVFVVSGNRPIQPIFAIKPGATGDISLPEGAATNEFVSWSRLRGGPYMPTPIAYGPHFYVCSNAGIVTCYDSASGEQVYRERIGGESYTASPVASDGRIYFVSEQGEVRVVKAGSKFELLAINKMDDVCMACPAISGGYLFVRTQHHLFALERGAKSPAAE
jgi:outer membrane protein assembly factor BamB